MGEGGEELAGARVGEVFLDDDGAACGEGAGGVAAADAVGEGEVGCAEDGDEAQGDEAGVEGVWRADGGCGGGVVLGAEGGGILRALGEEAQRCGHAGEFGGEFVDGEGGFVAGGGEDEFSHGVEGVGEGGKDAGAGGGVGEIGGGVRGQACGEIGEGDDVGCGVHE